MNSTYATILVKYSGLCGSDLHRIKNEGIHVFHEIGHEFIGTISNIESNEYTSFKIGDHIVGNPLLACGNCLACKKGYNNICYVFSAIGRNKKGCFGGEVNIPLNNIIKIDSLQEEYILADPLSVAFHAIYENNIINEVFKEKKIAIIGDGTIGISLIAILSSLGCKKLYLIGRKSTNFDIVKNKFPHLEFFYFGSNLVNSMDIVFECVGGNQNKTIDESINLIGIGGKIIILCVFPQLFNINFNNRKLFLKEAGLIASVAFKEKYFEKAIKYIRNNDWLKLLITKQYRIEDFEMAIMNNKSDGIKTIFKH